MSDYSWEDDLFDDDDFLDDSYNDSDDEPVQKPKKVKPEKPKKEKRSKKEKTGGLFKKKTKETPKAKAKEEPEEDDFDDYSEEDDLEDRASENDAADELDEYDEDDFDDEDDLDEDDETPVIKKNPEKKSRNHVHGLKKKSGGNAKGVAGKVATVVAVVAAVGIAGGLGLAAANGQISELKQSNSNLTAQIASHAMNVYTAKRDIQRGDEIITSGDLANVEISQVYTSLPESDYISDATTGYAQVDIKAGEPVMASEIGATNPVSELNDAIAAVEAENNKAKEMPYKISADFVDLNTGNTLAESRDLTLDPGANEKAFNTEAENIDGYVLKSIQVDKEGVHAYGVSEKSMKEGIVTMYYYTTKAGWGRHEIKGNIRVTFGYVKKDDPSLGEDGTSDVMDDSAWITTETDAVETDGAAEETVTGDENADAQNAETANTSAETTDKEEGEEKTTTSADTASAQKTQVTTKAATASTETAAKKEATTTKAKVASTASTTASSQVTTQGAVAVIGAEATKTAEASQASQNTASANDDEGPSVDTETIGIDDVN